MAEFIDVLPEELDHTLKRARHLRDLKVRISQNRRVLILEMIHRGRAERDDPSMNQVEVFPLSPPAAAQLCRLLQKAVDGYLYGEEDPKDAES